MNEMMIISDTKDDNDDKHVENHFNINMILLKNNDLT